MRVIIEGAIYKKAMSANCNPGEISFWPGRMNNFLEYIALAPHTINIEVQAIDTTQIEIDALKAAIKKEMADSSVRIAKFNNAINNLLCIENGTPEKVITIVDDDSDIPF